MRDIEWERNMQGQFIELTIAESNWTFYFFAPEYMRNFIKGFS